MTNTIHESLTSTEDAQVEIKTTAEVIKPVFGFGSKLAKEMKINFKPDGISYEIVDPSNVAMIGLDVPEEAFETYNVEETTLGVNLKSTMGALRAGRQRKSDSIILSVEGNRLKTVVQRDYDGTHMDLQNSVRLIDPDSIRQEPDIPNLHLPSEATIPRKLFEDVTKQIDTYSDHLSIGSDGDDLVLDGNNASGENTTAVVEDVVDNENSEDVKSILSLDYIKNDAVKAFKSIGADELTVQFGQEFPVRFEFATELNGVEVEGSWFQAPRIQSD